jgi:DNA-directed RNA polymerase specialized sigma24 family protein
MCRAHWSRLFLLAVQRGLDAHAAEDAVQDVFAALVRRDQLIVLASLSEENQSRHLTTRLLSRVANIWRDAHREKRGGGVVFVPLSREDGSTHDIADPRAQNEDGSLQIMRRALHRALTTLRAEMRPERWRIIAPCLLGALNTHHQTGASRVALHRARRRLRELLIA